MEEMLTVKEVAALLQIHYKTVYKLAKENVIPAHRIGRIYRFNRDEIRALTTSKAQ